MWSNLAAFEVVIVGSFDIGDDGGRPKAALRRNWELLGRENTAESNKDLDDLFFVEEEVVLPVFVLEREQGASRGVLEATVSTLRVDAEGDAIMW